MSSGLYPVLFRYPVDTPGPVMLVASFNHWDPSAHQLRRMDQEWRITVYLPAGTYPYAFVREGQFVKDPDPRRSVSGARYSVFSVGDKAGDHISRARRRVNGAAGGRPGVGSRGGDPKGAETHSKFTHHFADRFPKARKSAAPKEQHSNRKKKNKFPPPP
jgi:hypothetical protein